MRRINPAFHGGFTGGGEGGLDVCGAGRPDLARPLTLGLTLADPARHVDAGAPAVVADDAVLVHAAPLNERRHRPALLLHLPLLKLYSRGGGGKPSVYYFTPTPPPPLPCFTSPLAR